MKIFAYNSVIYVKNRMCTNTVDQSVFYFNLVDEELGIKKGETKKVAK